MAWEIAIPKLGMNVSEVNIVEWKVPEGTRVQEGDVIVVIETQKTEWNIEAGAAGFLHILKQDGMQATVGEVVGLLAETREELESLQKTDGKGVDAYTFVTPKTARKQEQPSEIPDSGSSPGRIKITPVARKMAEEHMIDISKVKGTGPGGRITREDIERALSEKAAGPETAPTAPSAPAETLLGRRIKERIPLRGMRKAISDHMYRSLSSAAQMTIMGEIDMTEAVRLREGFVAREKAVGVRISYVDFVVFVLARVLKELPDINCSLVGNDLLLWADINIGVAVAVGAEGLLVPVVKGADCLSLTDVSKTIRVLTENAQAGKLQPDDLSGGTFTLTSMGRRGVSYFQTPILNQPEAAILATGAMVDKPVVRDGQIVVAPLMPFSFTFDHRVINGFGAERFMGRVQELMGFPGLIFL
jgi:pyruvate dehydrogenase E2 component (dihydrolipoamide acetyltransferase)